MKTLFFLALTIGSLNSFSKELFEYLSVLQFSITSTKGLEENYSGVEKLLRESIYEEFGRDFYINIVIPKKISRSMWIADLLVEEGSLRQRIKSNICTKMPQGASCEAKYTYLKSYRLDRLIYSVAQTTEERKKRYSQFLESNNSYLRARADEHWDIVRSHFHYELPKEDFFFYKFPKKEDKDVFFEKLKSCRLTMCEEVKSPNLKRLYLFSEKDWKTELRDQFLIYSE